MDVSTPVGTTAFLNPASALKRSLLTIHIAFV